MYLVVAVCLCVAWWCSCICLGGLLGVAGWLLVFGCSVNNVVHVIFSYRFYIDLLGFGVRCLVCYFVAVVLCIDSVPRLGGCICDLFWVVCVLLDGCMGFVVAVACVLCLCLVLGCVLLAD